MDNDNIPYSLTGVIKVEQTENCILEICCNKVKSMKKLSHRLQAETGLTDAQGDAVATWIKDNYDLAPKDSLVILRQSIAANARDYEYV